MRARGPLSAPPPDGTSTRGTRQIAVSGGKDSSWGASADTEMQRVGSGSGGESGSPAGPGVQRWPLLFWLAAVGVLCSAYGTSTARVLWPLYLRDAYGYGASE